MATKKAKQCAAVAAAKAKSLVRPWRMISTQLRKSFGTLLFSLPSSCPYGFPLFRHCHSESLYPCYRILVFIPL